MCDVVTTTCIDSHSALLMDISNCCITLCSLVNTQTPDPIHDPRPEAPSRRARRAGMDPISPHAHARTPHTSNVHGDLSRARFLYVLPYVGRKRARQCLCFGVRYDARTQDARREVDGGVGDELLARQLT